MHFGCCIELVFDTNCFERNMEQTTLTLNCKNFMKKNQIHSYVVITAFSDFSYHVQSVTLTIIKVKSVKLNALYKVA